MTMANVLIVSGGVSLGAGLLLALYANREQAKAINAVSIRPNPWGTILDYGWWSRLSALKRSETRFNVGIALTCLGVLLQTWGSVLQR